MCTDPEHIDAFRLQCRDFCETFEDAFHFSPNGDLLCDERNRTAAEKLTSTPQVRFLIELVTGVFVEECKFAEPNEGDDTELANANNNKKLIQCYGVLYTFYRRMCQADGRMPKLTAFTGGKISVIQ